jgi:fucose permease
MTSGMDAEAAAFWASAFYLGMTVGRAVSGFMTMKFSDTKMINLGSVILALGVVLLLLPLGQGAAVAGVLLMGLGCAPIYPCIIHSTPAHFGADKSQAIIGVQMASAYIGTSLMPPLFGLIAQYSSTSWMPVYIGVIMVLMVLMHNRLNRVCPIE